MYIVYTIHNKIRSNYFHINYEVFLKAIVEVCRNKLKTTYGQVISCVYKLSQPVWQMLMPIDKLQWANRNS
jgi:hypothetical protein